MIIFPFLQSIIKSAKNSNKSLLSISFVLDIGLPLYNKFSIELKLLFKSCKLIFFEVPDKFFYQISAL